MAEKKRSIRLPIFMIILVELIGVLIAVVVCGGCASQAKQQRKQMDSTHYVAQVQQPQGYPCPECGDLIPEDKINPNIRIENTCPDCREVFFGKPVVELESNESQKKHYQGPIVFGRGYYSDIKHDSKFDSSVKKTWEMSPDGNSGSMSQTLIRTYKHITKGEHGTLVGPAARYGYGGY